MGSSTHRNDGNPDPAMDAPLPDTCPTASPEALHASGRTPPLPLPLLQILREDYRSHGCDWTKPGFRAVAIHRFGVWRMQIRSRFLRAPFSFLYKVLFRRCRNRYGIELPFTVQLGRRVIVEHQSGIVVHGCSRIGDDCILRQGVTLGNRNLERPLEAPTLGARVNVGAGAKILGAVTIGDDAVIGANAVVLIDVPPGALAAGVPARLVPTKAGPSR